MTPTKMCKGCRVAKPIESFAREGANPRARLRSRCKACACRQRSESLARMYPPTPCACGCGQIGPHSAMSKYRPGHNPHSGSPRGSVRSANPTEVPTPIDVAWAAGIYEGEGTCYTASNRGTLRASVIQADRWLLEKLLRLYGGAIYVVPLRTRIDGRPCKPTWVWVVTSIRATAFIEAIVPFLSPRRREQITKAYWRYGVGRLAAAEAIS